MFKPTIWQVKALGGYQFQLQMAQLAPFTMQPVIQMELQTLSLNQAHRSLQLFGMTLMLEAKL